MQNILTFTVGPIEIKVVTFSFKVHFLDSRGLDLQDKDDLIDVRIIKISPRVISLEPLFSNFFGNGNLLKNKIFVRSPNK